MFVVEDSSFSCLGREEGYLALVDRMDCVSDPATVEYASGSCREPLLIFMSYDIVRGNKARLLDVVRFLNLWIDLKSNC